MSPTLRSGTLETAPVAEELAIPPQVAREAVQWLLELQAADLDPAVHAEWARWLAADATHQRAWKRIEDVNKRLARASSPFAMAVAHANLKKEASSDRRRAIKALVLLFFGGGIAWQVEQRTPWREMMADLRTGVGERRKTSLADGTVVVLNTATAVNVRFSATERRLQLIAGEMFIKTANDETSPGRPFIVETRQGEALPLGTQFSVRQRENSSSVAVFDGAVEIRPRNARSNGLVLAAGQKATFSTFAIAEPTAADKTIDAAWTRGSIVAVSMRLAELIEELGRYSATPLSCDASVAGLRISGSYPTDNIDAALLAVSKVHSLEIHTIKRFWGYHVVRIVLTRS
ncbi:MAG: FecR domain-containing protein [Acidovorax sp.]